MSHQNNSVTGLNLEVFDRLLMPDLSIFHFKREFTHGPFIYIFYGGRGLIDLWLIVLSGFGFVLLDLLFTKRRKDSVSCWYLFFLGQLF